MNDYPVRRSDQKGLPEGIASFEKIITQNYYYVDKTEFILHMANLKMGGSFFLSRPRRFGKSLLVDTFRHLFEGTKELFKGLYIEDKWDWSQTFPVLKLDFSSGVKKIDEIREKIVSQLLPFYDEYSYTPRLGENIANEFGLFLLHIKKTTGKRVVVLIDEYDHPILNNLDNDEERSKTILFMKSFYHSLKTYSEHIHFSFMTGISTFAKLNIFSGLNNFKDITLMKQFNSICGYTENDLNTTFLGEMEGVDRATFKAWFDGYSWGGEAIYNPYDVLGFFTEREYRPYWIKTATSYYFYNLLKKNPYFFNEINNLTLSEDLLLPQEDVENFTTEALLFQNGYLTLDIDKKKKNTQSYPLKFPNNSVKISFYGKYFQSLLGNSSDAYDLYQDYVQDLARVLADTNIKQLEQLLTSLMALIPHQWYDSAEHLAKYEAHYASVILGYFYSLGIHCIHPESPTNNGRIDLTVHYANKYYIFEFKIAATKTHKAIEQIVHKNYPQKYVASGEPIHMIGIGFGNVDDGGRGLVYFDYMEYHPKE